MGHFLSCAWIDYDNDGWLDLFLTVPSDDDPSPTSVKNRLSFADGHVEQRRWRDLRTRPPVRGMNWLADAESPDNADLAWLQERTFLPDELE